MSKITQTYQRFSASQRIEHAILIVSFTLLALTGIPQKYANAGISEFILVLFGGIQTARIIHRVAATIFVAQSVLHFVFAAYKLYVRRLEASMVPGIKDAKDALDTFKYNVGLAKVPPKMPRYNFAEKVEYWAMVWGLVLMGITGFMLWNPLLTTRFLPGVIIPAAKVAHGLEAVLAVLAILLWHFYNVHIKHWNPSMIKGTMPRHQMEEEHGEELAKIEAGLAAAPVIPTAELRRRQRIFAPIATVLTLALFAGLVWLVTVETTAIETFMPGTIQPGAALATQIVQPSATVGVVAAPTDVPQPTSAPVADATETQPAPAAAALTWNESINTLFQTKCVFCHGPNASGGLAVDTYANTVKGGVTGPGIVPNDPDASVIVTLQQAGGHPGQFTAEELQQVIDWVNAGASEN